MPQTGSPLTVTLYHQEYLRRLPTAADGVEGLLKLAELFGAEETYQFIGFLRAAGGGGGQGSGSGVAGEARTALARKMVEEEMKAPLEGADPDAFERARFAVSMRLGYTTTTRTNFYKIVDGVTRREKWTGK